MECIPSTQLIRRWLRDRQSCKFRPTSNVDHTHRERRICGGLCEEMRLLLILISCRLYSIFCRVVPLSTVGAQSTLTQKLASKPNWQVGNTNRSASQMATSSRNCWPVDAMPCSSRLKNRPTHNDSALTWCSHYILYTDLKIRISKRYIGFRSISGSSSPTGNQLPPSPGSILQVGTTGWLTGVQVIQHHCRHILRTLRWNHKLFRQPLNKRFCRIYQLLNKGILC